MNDDLVPSTASSANRTNVEAIQYPVADLEGELVWARDFVERDERPKGFRCVGCQGTLTLRAGIKRRPHFAHRTTEECVGGETALHRTTIRVIAAALEEAIREGRPYALELVCHSCLLYTSPSPRDRQKSRMPSSA